MRYYKLILIYILSIVIFSISGILWSYIFNFQIAIGLIIGSIIGVISIIIYIYLHSDSLYKFITHNSRQANTEQPLPHNNTIPNTTFKDIGNAISLHRNDLSIAENILRESNWFKNLSASRQNELETKGFMPFVQKEYEKYSENLKVHKQNAVVRERQKAEEKELKEIGEDYTILFYAILSIIISLIMWSINILFIN